MTVCFCEGAWLEARRQKALTSLEEVRGTQHEPRIEEDVRNLELLAPRGSTCVEGKLHAIQDAKVQIRRSAVVYLSQDSIMLSYRVNCTGTHLRGRTLLIRELGRSDPTNDAEKGTAPT